MTDLSDVPEMDDLQIREGGYEDANVKISGIDLRRLNAGDESQFEVEVPDPGDYDDTNNNENVYFDKEEVFKQLNYECLDDGNEDEENLTPFDKMRREMTDVSGDGGVMKAIIKHGAGPVVPQRALCRVHYNAYLEYSDEPFDSSRLRGKQQQFKLGLGEVILGWEFGISTMKRGELSRFMITSNYAYGKMGCPPRIPADAVVLFEIELISFVDQGAADEFESFSEEERKNASFEQILEVVDALRKSGNEAFSLNHTKRAAGTYSRALRLLENANLKNEHEERMMKQSALKLYLNLSLCDLKDAKSGRACKYARKALEIDPKNTKALYRFARALRQLGDYQEAKRQIYKAHRLEPGDEQIKKEIKELDDEMRKTKKQDEALSRKMLNLDPITKVTKKKEEPAISSTMLNMLIERLKTFKEAEELPHINLPSTLTDDEIASLERAASDMGLTVKVTMEGENKSILVCKS